MSQKKNKPSTLAEAKCFSDNEVMVGRVCVGNGDRHGKQVKGIGHGWGTLRVYGPYT